MEFKMPDYRPDFYWDERMQIFRRLVRESVIDPVTGCYLFQGYHKGTDYGKIMFNYKMIQSRIRKYDEENKV